MPLVIVIPCPEGLNRPSEENVVVADIGDNISDHADAIGKAIVDATEKVWKQGYDPAVEPFLLTVAYR